MRAALGVIGTTLIICGCAPSVSRAQSSAQAPAPIAAPALALSNAVQILPATRLDAVSDSLPPGAIRTVQMGRFPGLANALNSRDSSGVHERHEDFTDIFVVQKGSAHLLYGGSAEGERLTAPGEWRGGTIRGGTQTDVHPGDVVVIPAGIPHQFVLDPGQRIAYLSFKVARKGAQ
jgi:mannose-6-phosphate isomerase-like protein (cupin superfamily)